MAVSYEAFDEEGGYMLAASPRGAARFGRTAKTVGGEGGGLGAPSWEDMQRDMTEG